MLAVRVVSSLRSSSCRFSLFSFFASCQLNQGYHIDPLLANFLSLNDNTMSFSIKTSLFKDSFYKSEYYIGDGGRKAWDTVRITDHTVNKTGHSQDQRGHSHDQIGVQETAPPLLLAFLTPLSTMTSPLTPLF